MSSRNNMNKKIELGDEVKHIHTGFKGVASARTTYLSGCDRITILPKVGKDGKMGEPVAFDEPEVEVIKANGFQNKNDKVGGFQPVARHALKA